MQFSVSFVFIMFYYIYGLQVGIDIDPNLLTGRTAYVKIVETAINSEDIVEKLDVLLLGNLRGFINVTDFFQIMRSFLIVCIIAIVILLSFILVSKHLKKFYPKSFIAIGYQIEELSRIEKSRDRWVAGIIIGFVVNIVAGIILAIFGV